MTRAETGQAAATLRKRLQQKTATIAVVGLGYVGLPLVRVIHDSGFRVLGYDADDVKIRKLESGETYIRHLGEFLILTLAEALLRLPIAL